MYNRTPDLRRAAALLEIQQIRDLTPEEDEELSNRLHRLLSALALWWSENVTSSDIVDALFGSPKED